MRLLIATDNYLPRHDGVVRFLQEIIPRLKEKYEITLVCPYHPHLIKQPDIEYVTIPVSKRHVGDFAIPRWKPWRIRKALKRADLVFTQTIGPIGACTIHFANRMHLPRAAYVHSLEWELAAKAMAPSLFKRYVPYLARFLARYLYSRVTRLFMPSDGISEQFTWEGIHTPRTVVTLGVNTEQFAPGDAKELREQLGFRDDDIVIGYHGRIVREKDLDTLVRAYVKLRVKYKHLKLLLIGDGPRQLERKFARQPGVTMHPAVDNVEAYLPVMDIYCLPSLTETTSLSVLEAMSCGLPVIATPVGFIKDYIEPGTTGLFAKIKDSYHFARQIELLINDEELRGRLGHNARAMVQKRFHWSETAKRLLRELARLRP